MVKPSPATDRMCFHLGDSKGVGHGGFAGGERVLAAREFLNLPEVGLRFLTVVP